MNAIRYTIMAILAIAAITFAFLGSPEAAAVTLLMADPAGATLDELAEQFAKKSRDLDNIKSSLTGQYEELKGKTENNERIATSLKTAIDEALVTFNGMKTDLKDMEQRIASGLSAQPEAQKSIGQQFVESEAGKRLLASGGKSRGTYGCEIKAVTSAAAGAGLIRSRRENDIVALPRERFVMRDLLTVIPVQESSVDYPYQISRTNNAAPVAETAAKAYSDYAWGQKSVLVRTLAHLAKTTKQALADAPRLAGEIEQEMRYGLGYVEERQFLYGDNTGQNLHGIVPQATAFAVAAGYVPNALATRIDVLRLAALQASLALYPADGIVLNELDWALIELTKTTDGAYLLANPQGGIAPRMWNLPVVATPAMLAGDFLVGAFGSGATIYEREGVEVLISTENADDFEKNLATMRCENRVAIGVKRPGAFISGDFAAALTPGAGMIPV